LRPGVTVHTRSFGKGPRPVLALHCTLGHGGAWRRVAAALEGIATLTAMDLPGHGDSGDWDGVEDLHGLATEMARGLLGPRQDLIGHSFGATVALRLAVEAPERVRTLTLIEPVFFAAALQDDRDGAEAALACTAPYTAALAAQDFDRAARLFHGVWGEDTPWAEIPEATRRYITERMPLIQSQAPMLVEDNAGLLAPKRLERAAMPCLILEGDRTAPVMGLIHYALEKRLPQARRHTIKGAGHMAPLTHPGAVAREIEALFEMTEE
jgi:pimeloyl-ACP methyl ester carboxylesterase